MVRFKEFKRRDNVYLSVVEDEDTKAELGTTFLVHPSLLRPDVDKIPVIPRSDFASPLTSRVTDRAHDDIYFLHSTSHDDSCSITSFSLLGRRIISGEVRWGHTMKIFGECSFILKYWEWVEHILSCFESQLRTCRLFDAVYASLYTYDRDPHVIRAFCEAWCSETNTLHTVSGEMSISLWDLYKLGGLPIYGKIYDEAVPSRDALYQRRQNNQRLIQPTCRYLFAAYSHLEKATDRGVCAEHWVDFWCKRQVKRESFPRRRSSSKSRPVKSRPKSTHNPSGDIQPMILQWTQEESAVFDSLEVPDDRRGSTYLAAFLSCWLCTFALPEDEKGFIRPGTFEAASKMAAGCTFSLAVPVLASIYRGLSGISNAAKPSSSMSFFPAHYLYSWLACYFNTHYVLDPSPPGPLMVHYSGFGGAKSFDDARRRIHEGAIADLGCTMLSKNKHDTLNDDGTLSYEKLSYLIALRSGFLPLRRAATFYATPYSPHRFSRQFGFWQELPGALKVDPRTRATTYSDALLFWTTLLCKNTKSIATLPSRSLHLNKFMTKKYQDWWSKVTVNDLRTNVALLQQSASHDLSKLKKNARGNISKDGSDLEDRDDDVEYTGEFIDTPIASRGEGVVETDDSDQDSETNFKRRGRKKRKTVAASASRMALEDNFFNDIPSCSDMPTNLEDIGEFDLVHEPTPVVDERLLEEVNLATQLLLANGGSHTGKDMKVVKKLTSPEGAGESVLKGTETLSISPAHSEHSVEGPTSLQLAAKKISIGAEDISPEVVKGKSAVAAISTTSFRPGPASQSIIIQGIRAIGAGYLNALRNASFDEVSKVYENAPMMYKSIERLNGDPNPLKKLVDDYVSGVSAYLALRQAALMFRHPDDLSKEKSACTDQLNQAKSHLVAAQGELDVVQEKHKAVAQKVDELEKALRLACEEEQQLRAAIETKSALLATVQEQVTEREQVLANLEAVPTLSPEEIEKLKEHERDVRELQLSLNPDNWMSIV